jgi:hypothetical protein
MIENIFSRVRTKKSQSSEWNNLILFDKIIHASEDHLLTFKTKLKDSSNLWKNLDFIKRDFQARSSVVWGCFWEMFE